MRDEKILNPRSQAEFERRKIGLIRFQKSVGASLSSCNVPAVFGKPAIKKKQDMLRKLFVTAFLTSFCAVGEVLTTPVAILNPGFEDPEVLPDDFDVASDWEAYDPFMSGNRNGRGFGVYPPPLEAHPNGVPAGLNAGWIYNDYVDENDGPVEIGMQQTLMETLAANTRYTLSVMVGNPFSYGIYDLTGFPGYRIELVAGTGPSAVVLVADENSLLPVEGTFELSTIEYSSPESGAVLGQSLTIRLICLPGEENGFQVDFDEVSLDAAPIEVEPMDPPLITDFQILENGDLLLTWDSLPGQTYSIMSDIVPSINNALVQDIPSQGSSTTLTFQDSAIQYPARFFQVLQQSP